MVSLIEYTAAPDWMGMVECDPAALVASATIPVKPPRDWFDDPGLSHLTPLTVDSGGRVFGHIASWEGSHIGRLGKVRAPRSRSKYKYFRTGVVETDSGDMVPVGQITLVGGHAPLEASAQEAVAHYDDTRSAVIDVAIGEDRHGIWVAGALRPDADDTKIRALRASSVSGDWRPIDGALELVAICSVNVPGFPIPRALAASGDPDPQHLYALVAAGTEPLVMLAHADITTAAIQHVMTDIETKMDWMRTAMTVLASADPDDDDDEDDEDYIEDDDDFDEDDMDDTEEFEVVDEESEIEASEDSSIQASALDVLAPAAYRTSTDAQTLAQEILTASGADLLWPDDGMPYHFTLEQVEAVSLRLRYRGSEQSVDTGARHAALVAGAAMPDGRLPILSEDDVRRALLIVPEGTDYAEHLRRRALALNVDLPDAYRNVLLAAAPKEKYDTEARKRLADSGAALPDGSYPIVDVEDLRNAIHAIGRAKNPAVAKAHIMKRARALNKVDLLPEKW